MKRLFKNIFRALYSIEQKLFGGLGLGRIPALKQLKKFLIVTTQPDRAEAHGFTFYLDPVEGFQNADTYKEDVRKVLEAKLMQGGGYSLT